MISYPITIPLTATTRESAVTLIASTVIGVSQSPYTFSTQVYDHDTDAWQLRVSINPLTRAEAQPWIAFLTALRGRRGTFMFGPAIFREPLGSGSGVPVLTGSPSARRTITTSGWTPSQTVLQAGDLFQLDDRLYMALLDVASDASGNATIETFPKIRASHAAGTALVLTDPKGIFRLTSNVVPVLDCSETGLFNVNFEAEEV
jgi:hypothetical protein